LAGLGVNRGTHVRQGLRKSEPARIRNENQGIMRSPHACSLEFKEKQFAVSPGVSRSPAFKEMHRVGVSLGGRAVGSRQGGDDISAIVQCSEGLHAICAPTLTDRPWFIESETSRQAR